MAKNFLVDINLNKNELQNGVVQNLATDPSNPEKGQIYFNTTTNKFRVYTGTKWDEMGTGVGTVTSVAVQNAVDGGLTISGSPVTSSGAISVGHTNKITEQSVQGLYPIKIDKNGHITEYGTAQTIPTKLSELTNDEGYIDGITSSDVTTALGYTPYNSTNPNGYITGINATDVTAALGFTPYNATNPNNYINGSQVPSNLQFITPYNATSNKIATASDIAGIATGMQFKGTIGTDGTAGTALPTTGVKIGDTYRISTKGTYNGESCNIGDLFIATATTPAWAYIPSGNDEAITSITAGTGLTGGTITSTGTIALATSGVTAGTYQGITVDQYGRVTGAINQGYSTLKKYVGTITGDGNTTDFTITHNLASRDVTIQVYDSTTYEDVIVDIERTSTTTARISFANAPTTNYKVVVIG